MRCNLLRKFAQLCDIDSRMALVTSMRYSFPSLEIDEELASYRQTVIKNMGRGSAASHRH